MKPLTDLKKVYEIMLASRLLDEFCEKLESEGVRVPQFHSSIGQEALSVGGVVDLRKDDYLLYTHRGYGSLLAKGISLETIMKDMFLKSGGTNEGFGSIMHTVSPENGIVGRNGVFGTRFTIATGLGLAEKVRRSGRVVVCYYGEAAGARGPFLEAMNMCALWKLPVVFIAEQNGFSVNSRTSDIYATKDLSGMWRGFPIQIRKIDGNDVQVVQNTVSEAVERVRQGDGPWLIEGITYRISPHIPHEDHMAYRTEEEIGSWRQKDPIVLALNALKKYHGFTDRDDEELRRNINSAIESAYQAALSDPDPGEEELFRYVYYRQGHAKVG